jgi:hypothetical protein
METVDDVKFQRRMWAAQRVGWVITAVAIIIALAGVFGTGPVSRASAQSGTFRVDYERFARLQQPTKITFSLSAANDDIQLAFSRRYLDSVQIERITPRPSKVESAGKWLVYHFAGQAPLAVTFHIRPEDFGRLIGAAENEKGGGVVFRQFIYP